MTSQNIQLKAKSEEISGYESGAYWSKRTDLVYYQYLQLIIRCIAPNAKSMMDVGTGMAPYLEWFPWIKRRVSLDIQSPYRSKNVVGMEGNLVEMDLQERFDVCTCLQVLEHVESPYLFAHKLLSASDLVLISVPYNWPKGAAKGHINDPVQLKDVVGWFGRNPNWHLRVQEPFSGRTGHRLFAIFDNKDPARVYDSSIWRGRRTLK